MPHSADLYTRKLLNKPIPHLIYKKVCGHKFIPGIVLQIHQYLMQVGSGFVEHLGTQFNLFFDHMLYVRGFFFSLLLNKRMHCSPLYSFSNNALKVTYLSVSLYKNVFQRFLGYHTLIERWLLCELIWVLITDVDIMLSPLVTRLLYFHNITTLIT